MTRRRSRFLASVAALLAFAAALAFAAGSAAAATRKYLPLAFSTMNHANELHQWTGWVGVPSTATTGQAGISVPLKLPVGSTITGISFFYTADTVGDVSVQAGYIEPAAPVTNFVQIAGGSSGLASLQPLLQTCNLLAPPWSVIKAGRSYLLYAHLDPGGFLWRVTVTYEAP